jgi:hypothetical protein
MRDSAMPANSLNAPDGQSKPPSGLAPELPAIYANQFYVAIYGGMVRLTFGELVYQGGEKMYPRTAVSIPPDRAVELANTILKIYQQVIAQASPPPVTPPPPASPGE